MKVQCRINVTVAVVAMMGTTMMSLANAFVTTTPRKSQIQPFIISKNQASSTTTQRHLFFWDNKPSEEEKEKETVGKSSSSSSSKPIQHLSHTPPPKTTLSSSSSSLPKEESAELIPRITTVNELQDFLDFLGEDDRLCVVKFHAKWCKSCQKFGIKYHHLALGHADKINPTTTATTTNSSAPPQQHHIIEKGNVRFAQVEFTANTKLCRSLQIKRLPYIHFYKASAGGRLTHFSCGPAKFQKVVDQMNEYLNMSDEEIKFAVAMEKGQSLGDEIATGLMVEQQQQQQQVEMGVLQQQQQQQSHKDSTASSGM